MHLDLTALRLESASVRLHQFISRNLERWAYQTVVEEIIRAAHGHESLYRKSVRIEMTGPLSFNVIFEYSSKGQHMVGVFLEHGTKPHKIRPRYKKALHWITSHAAAPFFPQFNRVRGRLDRGHFAMEVNHPGTTGLRAMDIGAKYGMPKLMNKIISETNQFLQESKIY